jgi:uncharacterized protein (TIGR02265 family)
VFDVALDPSTLLRGTLDVEALVARYPSHYLVKGMFCSRIADFLGGAFAELQPRLIAPPRGGRYLPFKDYPQADYTRLVVAAAAKRFPDLSLCEATRRLARDDFATFADSTMGKITLTVVGDAHSALLRMPDAFARVAPGPQLRTEERGTHAVRITFLRYFGSVEYMLGQIEGIVMSYHKAPHITVHRANQDEIVFDVEHV